MSQQLVLVPLGLVTEPNQLGQIPAGALSVASNIVIRSPAKIAPAPGWTTRYTLTGTDAGTTCAFVVATTGTHCCILFNRTAGWAFTWVNLATNTAVFGPTALTLDTPWSSTLAQSFPITRQPGFCSVLFQGQIFVNAFSTLLAWDTETPTTSTEARPRTAGTPSPVSPTSAITSGTAVPSDQYANLVTLTRRTVQGREYVSSLSAAYVGSTFGGSGDVDISVFVVLDNGWHRVGDVIEVYRTTCKSWGRTPSAIVLSKLGENAGSEYLLAGSYTLTATDIAAGNTTIVIKGGDAQLGRPCYTNQAISGTGANAFMPPALGLITAYKGHLFGFSPTEPPAFEMRPMGYWGYLDSTAGAAAYANGIGYYAMGSVVTFTSGLNTAVASSVGAIANLRIGARIIWPGGTRNVTNIVGTTITFDGAPAPASGTFVTDGRDQIRVDEKTYVNAESYLALAGNAPGFTRHEVVCPALQLSPYSNVFITVVPSGNGTVIIRRTLLEDTRTSMQIQATRGENWVPKLPNYTETALSIPEKTTPNGVVWSENNQPESWPGVNLEHFSRGQPHAVVTTRDAIFCWYSDGLWRFSGTGGTAAAGYDWRGDLVATGITISGSQACCVLNDVGYAYTSEGFISFTSAGQVTRISQGRIGDLLPGPPWDNGPYNIDTAVFVCADEETSEIIIKVPTSTALYRYNTLTDTFVQTQPTATLTTHAAYSRYTRSLLTVGKTAGGSWVLETDTGAVVSGSVWKYQPFYTDNPYSLKHWQQLDLAFTGAPSVVFPTFNSSISGAAIALTNAGPQAQARGSWDIDRDSPAIANMIELAITVGAGGGWTLQGASLQFEYLTEQRDKR